MKKIILILISIIAMQAAVAQQTAPKANAQTQGKVKYLTTDEFLNKVWNYRVDSTAWKYRSTRPCVIDFYATWCGPCKMLSPIVEQLSNEQPGIDFYKVDVDKEKELAAVFGVRSIPMLLFVPKRGTPQAVQGLQSKEVLMRIIDHVIYGRVPQATQQQPAQQQ
ncbi:MAG: thioredoxin family protein [Bacteroidales bacterium]|nr:thioredoxin family protein [Bacteroidales bacterium]